MNCPSKIELAVIRDTARLEQFRTEWEAFTTNIAPANPFQTPQWLLTWWRHLGSGEPHVLVFRMGKTPIGVLPCFLHEWQGRRQLTLMGNGVSDYLDPLLDPQWATGIVDSLAVHLSRSEEWDVCDWQDLSADSPLILFGTTQEDTPCTRIRLAAAFDEFLAARPAHLRRDLRRDREKAQSLGQIELQVSTDADPELLDMFIRLHRERWQTRGETGMIEANRAALFLRAAALELAAAGQFRMFALRLEMRVVAMLMAFCDHSTVFAYLTAFDPELKRFGFSRELLRQAIRYAHTHHFGWWDFLRGDEPFKFTWGADAIPKRRMMMARALISSAV